MNETNNIFGRSHEIHLALQKTGRASEDPNLPIDDRRKIILPYRPWRNTNKQAYDKIYVAGVGIELMWEAPTKFGRI